MLKKELELLRSNEATLTWYLEGMSSLHRSGVISFLRSFGRVHLAPKDTPETVALNGAYAAGFQDCLDLLFNFKEQFLDPNIIPPTLKADYGGVSQAVKRGDLTEEEANAIRAKPNVTKS